MNETEVHKTQALWYAWGQKDAGVTINGDVFDFANAYQERRAAYPDRIGHSFPIQDAFRKWQAGESLMADVEAREAARRQ